MVTLIAIVGIAGNQVCSSGGHLQLRFIKPPPSAKDIGEPLAYQRGTVDFMGQIVFALKGCRWDNTSNSSGCQGGEAAVENTDHITLRDASALYYCLVLSNAG